MIKLVTAAVASNKVYSRYTTAKRRLYQVDSAKSKERQNLKTKSYGENDRRYV